MDRDQSALMLGHSGAESVHAAMRKWSSETKIGLVESCVQDAARAASQVAALNNYKLHGRKGRGPSLFELRIRDATVVGNVESFFPKLNTILTQPDLREFSSVDPLEGDVETVQMKRGTKMPSGPNVVVEDSHRPDVILVTRPKKRKFRGIADRDASLLSPESVVNLSSDVSGECDPVIVENRRSTRATPGPSEPVVNENTPTRGTAPRPAPDPVRPAAPEPVRRRIEEANVMPGMLFISRISSHGKSPRCRGQKCGRLIREEGLKQSGRGVIGICWKGGSKFTDPLPYVYWFCPNNKCCQKCSLSSTITGVLPPMPSKFPVGVGTDVSEQEVLFLQERGVEVGPADVAPAGDTREETVSVGDVILNVNSYPERVDSVLPHVRLTRRNRRRRRRRSDTTDDAKTRIRSSRTDTMVCTSRRRIDTGNATGLRLLVQNITRGIPSVHCVQICVFPCCSCRDFMYRESKVKTYFPCKHMYWCFANICNRDIERDQSINQPILTLNEVRDLVSSSERAG